MNIIQAFCFTLLHSLWQGLLFAVITGIVMVLTRSSRAELRYNCLVLLFCGFLVTTGVTFWLELSSHLVKAPTVAITDIPLDNTNYTAFNTVVTMSNDQHTFWEKWASYFTAHASLVVLVWCILFCARLVQILASLGYIQRVRHYKTHTPPAYWNEQLAVLAARVRVQKRVRLSESGIVKVPLVVGYLKPVILVPLGLLTSLPADEMEAILLHELAHIQRRDYLVNLLQSFVQAIFFFNPAIIWISALIREERENCCDDIAIAATNNRKQFVKALVAFQEYNLRNTRYAMTFPGKKQHLLNRVKRIIHNRNKTLNTMEKSLLSLGIAAAIVFSLASARNIPVPPTTAKPAASPAMQPVLASPEAVTFHRTQAMIPPAAMQTIPVTNDTLAQLRDTLPAKHKKEPQPKGGGVHTEGNGYTGISTHTDNDGAVKIITTEATANDGTRYGFKKINGNLAELVVNGVAIPGEDYRDYYADIEKVEMAQHRNMEDAMARHRADQQRRQLQEQQKRQTIALRTEMQRQQHELNRQMDMTIKKEDIRLRQMEQQEPVERDMQEQRKQVVEMKRQRDSLNKVIDETIYKMTQQNLQKAISDTARITSNTGTR